MYRHIVVATDGSELAMGAVGHAVDIARVFSATLTIVTVVDTLPVVDLGGLVISPSTSTRCDKQLSIVAKKF